MAANDILLLVIGAVIGSASSIIMTFLYDLIKSRIHENHVRRISINAVTRELKSNLDRLVGADEDSSSTEDRSSEQGITVSNTFLVLDTSTFDSIVSSGSLFLLEVDVQEQLHSTYALIKTWNQYSTILISVNFKILNNFALGIEMTEEGASYYKKFFSLQEDFGESIKKDIPSLLERLKETRHC